MGILRLAAALGLVVVFGGCTGASGRGEVVDTNGDHQTENARSRSVEAPATDPAPCPADLLAAIGTPCAPAGRTCGSEPAAMRLLMCSGGTWTEMAIAPPPPPPRAEVAPSPPEPSPSP